MAEGGDSAVWSGRASRLLSIAKRARLYIVKLPDLEIKINLPNVIVLDGTQEDVPLKSGFADVIWVQSVFSASIPRCVRELRRVVKAGRIVCFGAPQLHLAEVEGPLDIGQYVQKMAYELMGGPGITHGQIIEREILKCFAKTHLHRVESTSFFLSQP